MSKKSFFSSWRIRFLGQIGVGVICLIVLVCFGFLFAKSPARQSDAASGIQEIGVDPANQQPHVPSRFPVTIRQPKGPPGVVVRRALGPDQEIVVACSTCHASREPNRATKSSSDLDEFHQGMQLNHGQIACLACHHSKNYDSLQLADGSSLAFTDVMTLCSQCHAKQRQDFDHGAHGGMTGYWDLNRGPRNRNHCVDCHHPHQPQFPKMRPTFKPRDRFLHPHNQVDYGN